MDAATLEAACVAIEHVCQREDIQDILEQQGAGDLLLTTWATSEAKVLDVANIALAPSSSKALQGAGRAPMARRMAVVVLGNLVREFSLPEKAWTKAVLILDVYCSRNPDALQADSLPGLCAALIRLQKKWEEQGDFSQQLQHLAPRASALVDQMLVATGQPPSMVLASDEDLDSAELAVLSSIKWRVNLPTVFDWITLISARLNTLTCKLSEPIITELWGYSNKCVRLLTLHCPASRDYPPRRVAQGFFCLICTASGLLPADYLGLSMVEYTSSWTLPPCPEVTEESKPNSLEFFLAALSSATNSNYRALQQDAQLVKDMLSTASTSGI